MAVVVPAWFKGRQGKAEEAAPNLLRLTGPNLNEWYIGLRRSDTNHWVALLRKSVAGPDTASAELRAGVDEYSAWEAAFELYRNQVII